eukprot:COSAG01_NODE_4583_length_4900_cov_9.820662_3_plen_104_part_00
MTVDTAEHGTRRGTRVKRVKKKNCIYCALSLGRPAADPIPAAAAAFFRGIGGEIGSRRIGGSAVKSLLAARPPARQVGCSQWLRSGPHSAARHVDMPTQCETI